MHKITWRYVLSVQVNLRIFCRKCARWQYSTVAAHIPSAKILPFCVKCSFPGRVVVMQHWRKENNNLAVRKRKWTGNSQFTCAAPRLASASGSSVPLVDTWGFARSLITDFNNMWISNQTEISSASHCLWTLLSFSCVICYVKVKVKGCSSNGVGCDSILYLRKFIWSTATYCRGSHLLDSDPSD